MSNRSAEGVPPSTGLQKVCDRQMMHCKMDSEPENDGQATLFVANALQVCKKCLHTANVNLSRRQLGFHPAMCTEEPASGPLCIARPARSRSRSRLLPAPLAGPDGLGLLGTCLE